MPDPESNCVSSSTTAHDAIWHLWFDGTAAPNPGAMGLGVVLESPDGARRCEGVRHAHGCNNMAEIHALMHGLKLAAAAGARSLMIHGDSDFVVRHVGGDQHTDAVVLAQLVDEARILMATFQRATLRWIPRHRNGEADTLARQALGLPPKPARRPVSKKKRR